MSLATVNSLYSGLGHPFDGCSLSLVTMMHLTCWSFIISFPGPNAQREGVALAQGREFTVWPKLLMQQSCGIQNPRGGLPGSTKNV